VAGVKLEIDEEKWAGGVEVWARFELWSAAIKGINREKAQMAHERDYTVIRGFSRCRLMGKRISLGKDWPRNGRKTTKSLRIGELGQGKAGIDSHEQALFRVANDGLPEGAVGISQSE
jgi:hypothetical protein